MFHCSIYVSMMLLSSLTCRWHIYDVHITLSVVFWLTYCLDGRLERGGAVDTDCIASSLQSGPSITWWCLLLLNHVIFISVTVATFVTCLNNTWYNDNNNGLYYKWFFFQASGLLWLLRARSSMTTSSCWSHRPVQSPGSQGCYQTCLKWLM